MTQKRKKTSRNKAASGANSAIVGYEAKLWDMANALRGSMDSAEYKHVVLGLIFLKYVSDAFEEKRRDLESRISWETDPDDPDEYRADNIFWVPPEARWQDIKAQARQPTIGKLVDKAMVAIERVNTELKGVLPSDYARPALNNQRLGQVIDLISNIKVGDKNARSKDVLGRVYEYFLSQFADAEGKKGGEFYTPRCVVKLLMEMLEPYEGRVYDPCCGSSGMFVQSIEFATAHAGGIVKGKSKLPKGIKPNISIYGQESNYTTWRLAKMNLAIRGIEGQIAHGDTFHDDQFPDLRADFILANPPFNVSDWEGERLREDKRWKYGIPPGGNANFAWVQHIVHHLAPNGAAGFVLANGSMSVSTDGQGEIRKNLVKAGIVECVVALPGQLFYSTPIPACLWFLSRQTSEKILFVDARSLGRMVDRTHKELTDEEICLIAETYRAWKTEDNTGEYKDVPGFCKGADLDEVRRHGYVLTPGRYIEIEAEEDDGELFEEKMTRLSLKLREQQKESAKLDAAIAANLQKLGYDL